MLAAGADVNIFERASEPALRPGPSSGIPPVSRPSRGNQHTVLSAASQGSRPVGLCPQAGSERSRGKLMRIRRRWKIAFAVVLTVLIALLAGVVVLLNTPFAAGKVAGILGDKLGTRVEIDAMSVGLFGSTLTGVRVFEPDAPPGAEPLLSVQALEADTSLCSLITGRITPNAVVIRNPAVRLRFTAEGRLATRLPQPPSGGDDGAASPLPDVRIMGASVRVRQDGKPDASLSGIDLHLTGGGLQETKPLTLSGAVADAAWGNWEIRGEADPSFASASVDVKGLTPIVMSADRLAQLPLVDPAWVRNYPFEVRVVASLRLVLRPGGAGLSYRAEARLEDGTATVAPAELTVAQLAGVVAIEDAVVTLKGLTAAVAGGTIAGDGTIDLTGDTIRVKLGVAAQRLDVTRVPASWGLNRTVEAGRFSGNARLLMDLLPGGQMRTGGEGRCVVTGARLLGVAADGPVELWLRSTGRGFRFGAGSETSPQPNASAAHDSWLVFMAVNAVKPLLRRAAEPDSAEGRVRVRFGLRDVDLVNVMEQLRVEVPFAIAGRVSLRVEVDLPANNPDDLTGYRVAGSIESPGLVLEGVAFQQIKARVAFRDGTLTLEELSGTLSDPSGATRFAGTARLGVVPAGALAARLSVAGLPLGMLSRLVPGASLGFAGAVSGTLDLTIPAGKLSDVAAWDGKASLQSPSAAAFGWTLQGFDASLALRTNTAVLTRLRGTLEGAEVLGSANVQLAGDYPFQARLSLKGFELAAADRLLPLFRPPVHLEGRLTTEVATAGRLRTRQFQLNGAAELAAAHVEGVPIDRVGCRWIIDPDRVRVTDIAANLAGGTLTGSAEVPFQGATAGAASFTLRQVDLKEVTHNIPALRSVSADGQVDGTFAARIPVNRREVTASASLVSSRMRVRGVTAERVSVSAEFGPGGIGYRLAGQTLGGTVSLAGRLPLGESVQQVGHVQEAAGLPPGQLRIEGIRLERLVESLGQLHQPSPISGVASLSMDYQHDPADGWPASSGRFRLAEVRWGDRELTPLVQADLALSREQVRVKDVTATLSQGRFRAHAVLNLIDPDRSWAEAVLEQVPVATLLGPAAGPAERLDGRVTLTARTLLGRQARGDAVVFLPRGKIGGLTVINARTSLDWNIMPAAGRGELAVREFSGQVAGGRVAGKANFLMATDGTRLDGKVQFTNVEVGEMARAADTLAAVGVGRATGLVAFSGRNVHSVKDLTGTVRATLGPSQALRVPVLKDIVPFLGPGRSVNTSFKRSEVQARLNRGGVIRVERLALAGAKLSVFAEGTVTLPDRLNLSVVAATGDLGVNTSLLEKIGMQVPVAVGPVPVGLIIRASKYLSDRTVRVHVTGTAHSPQVRVNPVEILSEETVRFFLGGTTINPLQKYQE